MADNAAPHARSEYPLLECFFEFWEEVENLRWHVQSPDGGGDPFLPAAAGGRCVDHLAEGGRFSLWLWPLGMDDPHPSPLPLGEG